MKWMSGDPTRECDRTRAQGEPLDLPPEGDRLVMFWSDLCVHEDLPNLAATTDGAATAEGFGSSHLTPQLHIENI